MRKTIGDQLLELKNQSGLSLSEIARLAGYKGASSLQRYFSPAYDPEALDYRTAQKLAEAMEGAGDPPVNQYDIMALTAAVDNSGIRPIIIPVQLNKEMKGFIPVYHTTSFSYEVAELDNPSSVDAMEIDFADPVETLRCPPVLERRDVYGFYMAGLSMRPRFNPGEIVFTDGRKPPSLGDDVLIILNSDDSDGGELYALFGKLKEIEKDGIILQHYDGPIFPVHFGSINTTRRVMEAAELLGGYLI